MANTKIQLSFMLQPISYEPSTNPNISFQPLTLNYTPYNLMILENELSPNNHQLSPIS